MKVRREIAEVILFEDNRVEFDALSTRRYVERLTMKAIKSNFGSRAIAVHTRNSRKHVGDGSTHPERVVELCTRQ